MFYTNNSYFFGRTEWAHYLYNWNVTTRVKNPNNITFGIVILSWIIQCLILISGDVHPHPGPMEKKLF